MGLIDRTALEIFRTIATEFSETADETVEAFIEIAGLWVGESVWGKKYKTGLAYMAAHLMATGERGTAAGAVTSERVGNVAINYSAPSTDDALKSTGYGNTFFSLRRTLALSPLVRQSSRSC